MNIFSRVAKNTLRRKLWKNTDRGKLYPPPVTTELMMKTEKTAESFISKKEKDFQQRNTKEVTM